MKNIHYVGEEPTEPVVETCCNTDSDLIDHNSLGSLQGGITNERYHLTKAQWEAVGQQTGGGYEPVIVPGGTTQYWRGDKTWQILNTGVVPESGNLYLTTPRVQTIGDARYEPILTAGTSLQYYAGNKTWQTLLDGSGKILSTLLPSYVDDVIEVVNFAALPTTGELGKIYITVDNNKVFRWTGSVYIEIVASPGSTDAVPEGSVNKYYTDARVAVYGDAHYQPLGSYQATLVSGTNIKTINSTSLLGSGNINLQTPLVAGTDYLAPNGSAASLTNFPTLNQNTTGNAGTVTNGVYTTGSYSNPSWITALAWSKIATTPTTLSGYGITDAYPLTGNPSAFVTIGGDLSGSATSPTVNTINSITKTYYDPTSSIQTQLNSKQATLVSGTSIKSINGTSLLGSGDLVLAASPGGSDTQVQFNSSGSFAGDSNFTWDNTNKRLTIPNLNIGNTTPDPAIQLQVYNTSGMVRAYLATNENTYVGLQLRNGYVSNWTFGVSPNSDECYIDNNFFGASGNAIKVFVGGILRASAYRVQALNTAPSSATATGITGEIRIAADAIYVCTATNTWVKAVMATF